MKICFATSECVPFAKAGGLGDVSGALPGYLKSHGKGMDIRIVLPLYRSISRRKYKLKPVPGLGKIRTRIGSRTISAAIWQGTLPDSDVPVFFIDSPHFFDRPHIYSDARDESTRFIYFQRAALDMLMEMNWRPDVIHANDWPTGLLPALKRFDAHYASHFGRTATMLSIHNIGYQGVFHQKVARMAGLPDELTAPFQPLEYYGRTSFLKAGIALADVVATVSPTYAREIQTPQFGMGLDGDIRSRRDAVFGILNGIDTNTWNPEKDELIPFTYGVDSLERKKKNTHALRKRFSLDTRDDLPIIGIVSRLTEQKGFHLLAPVLEDLLKSQPFALAVVGTGEAAFQEMFSSVASRFPGRIGTFFGYDESLAHLVEAGSDMFLMPSMYEPCGLNQMYSLRYGTVPIVRKTGGLADTVIDVEEYPKRGNGFVFLKASSKALLDAVGRACKAYGNTRAWRAMQIRGMNMDFSWESSAKAYRKLYDGAIRTVRA